MTFNVKSWADEFFRQPVEQMPENLATAFLAMSMAEAGNIDNPERQALIEAEFAYQILEAKCAQYSLAMTKYAKMFMFALIRTPGEATMYIAALKARQQNTVVTMELLSGLFPEGFLTQDALKHMWGSQKYKPQPGCIGDNSLDTLTPRDF